MGRDWSKCTRDDGTCRLAQAKTLQALSSQVTPAILSLVRFRRWTHLSWFPVSSRLGNIDGKQMPILMGRDIGDHVPNRSWRISVKPVVRSRTVSNWYFVCLFSSIKSLEQFSISLTISIVSFVLSMDGYKCFVQCVPRCISLLVVWWCFHQLYIESVVYWRSFSNPLAIDRSKRLDAPFPTGSSTTTPPTELVIRSKLAHTILFVVFESDGRRIRI